MEHAANKLVVRWKRPFLAVPQSTAIGWPPAASARSATWTSSTASARRATGTAIIKPAGGGHKRDEIGATAEFVLYRRHENTLGFVGPGRTERFLAIRPEPQKSSGESVGTTTDEGNG